MSKNLLLLYSSTAVILALVASPISFAIPSPNGSYNYCGQGKKVSLVFQNGPFTNPEMTPLILQELAEANILATFFISPNSWGQSATEGICDVVQQIIAGGHEIQSNSFSFPHEITSENLPVELQQSRDWVEACGVALSLRGNVHMTQFMPPFGTFSEALRQQSNDLGWSVATWNIASHDWNGPEFDSIGEVQSQKLLLEAKGVESFVVSMHDWAYVQGAIAGVKAVFQEHSFVTASQCYSNCNQLFCSDENGAGTWPSPTPAPTSAAPSSPVPGSYNYCGAGQKIALSFDDGPFSAPGTTQLILDELAEANVVATFFMSPNSWGQADWDTSLCGIVNDIVAAGHEIQSHTYSHWDLLDPEVDMASQLQQARDWVSSCGVDLDAPNNKHMTQLRPPYGSFSEAKRQEANALGYTIATWNLDSQDWQGEGFDIEGEFWYRTGLLQDAGVESMVVLMHDISYISGYIGFIKQQYPHHSFITGSECYEQCGGQTCASEPGYPTW